MIRQNFDREWSFRLISSTSGTQPQMNRMAVDLPHDFSIIQRRDPESQTLAYNGFFPGGAAVYEKILFIPAGWKGKKVILEFEGIYMNSLVRFNHHIVGRQPYGYTSFHCDLTPYISYGKNNKIQVAVNNSAVPNTRWYSGSGIYRHVWLMVGESIHIEPWGVYASAPAATAEAAVVSVKTRVENSNKTSGKVTVRSGIIDANGDEVACDDSVLELPPEGIAEASQSIGLRRPVLWSVEQPYLYTLRTEVIREGMMADRSETGIGIRSIAFDPQNGFSLNGVPMKLQGGCVHHDCGILGAASYDRAEERKVELHKANGFNAIRCSHNPPSPAFLDACDRLGMLIIDEAFDCWREPKLLNDYSNYFEDWWERDLAAMVLRDRNHPSVIMWSTGNEVPERSGLSEGYAYAGKMADFVRSLDRTRPVTNALNNISANPELNGADADLLAGIHEFDYFGELSCPFVRPLDVVGYNYRRERYEYDKMKYPGRIICSTESFPKDAYDSWEAAMRQPNVVGDFVWTSMDYLGEAGLGHVWYTGSKEYLGKYPWHQAYCGDMDLCGNKRPQSYYRDCVWGISAAPYIAVYRPGHDGKEADISPWGWPDVVPYWTWPGFEGKPVNIDVYSTADEVELFLNGKSMGRKLAGRKQRYIASFCVAYEAGELAAAGYEKGMRSRERVIRTAGAPAGIRLTPDRCDLNAEFGNLSYVMAEIVDARGNVVHTSCAEIYFTACGRGSLIAVGSSNPISEEMYTGNCRKAYEGRAMAVVRADGTEGDIIVTAAAEGIPTENVTIRVR